MAKQVETKSKEGVKYAPLQFSDTTEVTVKVVKGFAVYKVGETITTSLGNARALEVQGLVSVDEKE